jgi:hypothetical protein
MQRRGTVPELHRIEDRAVAIVRVDRPDIRGDLDRQG